MSQLTKLLNSTHRKQDFSCGKEALDNYIRYQAGQDVKRKLSACFVLPDGDTGFLKGYYTLANNSIPLNLVPAGIKKKLPEYPSIPTTLLGRLAVDNRFKAKGIGKLLLMDALKRSYYLSETIGSFAVIVDPIDNEAEHFYLKFGFVNLPDSGKMFLPMQVVKQLGL